MPEPPPGLLPLPLDSEAVAGAIAACQRSAGLVATLAEVRARAAADARIEWRGTTRDDFDRGLLRLEIDAVELITDLLRTAAGLAAAASEVVAQNRRRALAREDWARGNHRPS